MVEPNIRAVARRDEVHTIAQLDQLERDLQRVPLPSASQRDIEALGKMSADAVLAQYENAAREFEIMGDEVKDRIEKLKTSLEEADASMKLLSEAAKAIRDKGKLAHAQIEEMSSVAKHISDTVADTMKKLNG